MAYSAETEAIWGGSLWGDDLWGGADLTASSSGAAVVTLANRNAGAAAPTVTPTAIQSYALGNVIRLTATFTQSGTVVDPSAVRFKIRPPIGDVVTLTYGTDGGFTQLSTGVYYYDYTPTIHGTFLWRAEGLTAKIAAGEQSFRVQDSAFD